MSEVSSSPPPARRRRLRTILQYGFIALAVLAVGLFLARRQIGGLLARKLDEQLIAAGVFVDWKSATWVPGPGIRLRDLALYRDSAKRDRLALIGNVKAIKGDSDWSRWDMVNVEVENAPLILGAAGNETPLEHLHLRLRIEPGKVELRECRASMLGLRVEAKGSYAPAPATQVAKTKAPAKPKGPDNGMFADVNLDWVPSVKEWLRFEGGKEGPVLKVEFHSLLNGGGLDLAASLDGKKFQWRGQDWDFVDAAVRTSVGDGLAPIEVERLRMGRAGEVGEATGRIDTVKSVIRISKLDSGLDALALVRAFVPGASTNLVAVTATGSWRLKGEGEIPLEHPGKILWNGRLSLGGELAYAGGGTSLALQNPAFDLQMKEQVISISGLKAGLWEGNLDAPATRILLASRDGQAKFETQLALHNARLQSVVNSFGAAQKQPGVVQATWKGSGGFELNSISGGGSLGIHQAEFFRIPLLGPLHLVFDKLTPGFGKDVASTLTANHRMGGGNLHINNLKLESKLTRIEADGVVDLNKQYAHLTAKAKLQGIVGLATHILSALLEVEGEGPVSDVHWKLKNVPGTGLIGDAAGAVGKAGGTVIEGAGNAVKDAGKAGKGLLKIPGKLLGK